MNYKTAQILRGAETIKKNSMTTDTPRTDAMFWKFHTHDDMVNLARDLERELNAANAALEQMTRDAMTTAHDRDEWMAKAMKASVL